MSRLADSTVWKTRRRRSKPTPNHATPPEQNFPLMMESAAEAEAAVTIVHALPMPSLNAQEQAVRARILQVDARLEELAPKVYEGDDEDAAEAWQRVKKQLNRYRSFVADPSATARQSMWTELPALLDRVDSQLDAWESRDLCTICSIHVPHSQLFKCRPPIGDTAGATHSFCVSCTSRYAATKLTLREHWAHTERIDCPCMVEKCKHVVDALDLIRAQGGHAVASEVPQIAEVLIKQMRSELVHKKPRILPSTPQPDLKTANYSTLPLEETVDAEAVAARILYEDAQFPKCPNCFEWFYEYYGCNAVRHESEEHDLGCKAQFCGICQVVFDKFDDVHQHARDYHSHTDDEFSASVKVRVATLLILEQQVAERVLELPVAHRPVVLARIVQELAQPDRNKYGNLKALSVDRIRTLVFAEIRREPGGHRHQTGAIPTNRFLFGRRNTAEGGESSDDARASIAHVLSEQAMAEARLLPPPPPPPTPPAPAALAPVRTNAIIWPIVGGVDRRVQDDQHHGQAALALAPPIPVAILAQPDRYRAMSFAEVHAALATLLPPHLPRAEEIAQQVLLYIRRRWDDKFGQPRVLWELDQEIHDGLPFSRLIQNLVALMESQH